LLSAGAAVPVEAQLAELGLDIGDPAVWIGALAPITEATGAVLSGS
jgi:hypothetical protein